MKAEDVITLPCPEHIVRKTVENTIKKFKNTSPALMYSRQPVEILDNIFMGDIAKNCLIDYLLPFAKNPVTDYDEIRTDDFKHNNPGWDFKIGNRGIKVEVKSSIPPNAEPKEEIIRKRDIKITASHDNGATLLPPEHLEAQIHVQIYFYAKTCKNSDKNRDEIFKIINENHDAFAAVLDIKKYEKPLFFGWAGKKEIQEFSKNLKPPTWSFGRTKRTYWRCPIHAAHTLEELIHIINTY